MPMPCRRLRSLVTASAVAIAALLAGCGIGGIDGVELNGGVFDALGVSSKSQQKRVEPKVAARPGIVLPPVADRLPQPGSEPDVAAQEWPDDDDGRRKRADADLDRQHREFCERAIAKARTRGKDAEVEVEQGPKGPCTTSVLNIISTQDSNNQ
jgi:hypothetical protein